jgi:hypothetical protein
MNEQSRDTGNIVYKIENEDKEQNTAQKTKKDFQHAPPPQKKRGRDDCFLQLF